LKAAVEAVANFGKQPFAESNRDRFEIAGPVGELMVVKPLI
jgi:hypothetical protein